MGPTTAVIRVGVMFVAMLGTVAPASANTHPADSGRVTLTVAIDDRARVPGPLLKDAEQRAADVFRMSNVDIVWVVNGGDGRLLPSWTQFTVIVAMTPTSVRANLAHSRADVMGQAVPDLRRAYVYYDRVFGIVTPTRDIVTILGDVMAHELGHLLLPRGHAVAGIMRAEVNMTSRRLQTFTDVEANQIRRRITDYRLAETN
jgi:hypothetical protein